MVPRVRRVDRFAEGAAVQGVVRSVNDFGVFLDIGASGDALLPWSQVVENDGPCAGDTLDVVIAKVDSHYQRITLGSLGRRARQVRGERATGGHRARSPSVGQRVFIERPLEEQVGGWVYDVELGVRQRKKGGKGDGRGAYTYADGMSFSEFAVGNDVSGFVTNIEQAGCWMDIGALKDGFLRWEDAPRSSSRWQAGDIVEDLKILRVGGSSFSLKWDDEGVGRYNEKDWEKLFAQHIPKLPPSFGHSGSSPSSAFPSAGEDGRAASGRPEVGRSGLAAAAAEASARQRGAGERLVDRADRRRLAAEEPRGDPKEVRSRAAGAEDVLQGHGKGRGEDASAYELQRTYRRAGADSSVGTETYSGLGSLRVRAGDDARPSAGTSQRKGDSKGAPIRGAHRPAAAVLRASSAPPPEVPRVRTVEDLVIGEVVRGRVVGLSRAGAAVDFGCEAEGLVPRAFVTLQCCKGQVIPRLIVKGIDVNLGKVTLEPLQDGDSEDESDLS